MGKANRNLQNVLPKKCLARMEYPGSEADKTYVLDFIKNWNAYYAKPFSWKFINSDPEKTLEPKSIKLPFEAILIKTYLAHHCSVRVHSSSF